MAENSKFSIRGLKDMAVKSVGAIDLDAAKEKAQKAGEVIGGKALEIKDSAMAMKAFCV